MLDQVQVKPASEHQVLGSRDHRFYALEIEQFAFRKEFLFESWCEDRASGEVSNGLVNREDHN
jgi:hypothetical protein